MFISNIYKVQGKNLKGNYVPITEFKYYIIYYSINL